MIKIVEANDAAAVKALLWPERDRDGETEQRVSQIVADVRTNADAPMLRSAREFDRLGILDIELGAHGSTSVVRLSTTACARAKPV